MSITSPETAKSGRSWPGSLLVFLVTPALRRRTERGHCYSRWTSGESRKDFVSDRENDNLRPATHRASDYGKPPDLPILRRQIRMFPFVSIHRVRPPISHARAPLGLRTDPPLRHPGQLSSPREAHAVPGVVGGHPDERLGPVRFQLTARA